MGCTKIGHVHQWPTSGTLVVQRCEVQCNFCGDGKSFKYAWFLRRHIRAMHIKRGPYKDLIVSEDWDDAKQKKIRQRRKKEISTATAQYDLQPVYDQQFEPVYDLPAVQPGSLDVPATIDFGLNDILTRDAGDYGFALGDEQPSQLMPGAFLDETTVDSWLETLASGAYDLPPLEDASASYLFDAVNTAELNELPADVSPHDSISSIASPVEATFDDASIPFLPPYNVDQGNSPAFVADEPTPVFAAPDFFSEAIYNVDGFDFAIEDPTKLFLPDFTAEPEDTPLAASCNATPTEDEHFRFMMQFLEEMREHGMGIDQMLACVETFSRNLKQKDAVDLTDDDDQALNKLPTPTFSQILGEGIDA